MDESGPRHKQCYVPNQIIFRTPPKNYTGSKHVTLINIWNFNMHLPWKWQKNSILAKNQKQTLAKVPQVCIKIGNLQLYVKKIKQLRSRSAWLGVSRSEILVNECVARSAFLEHIKIDKESREPAVLPNWKLLDSLYTRLFLKIVHAVLQHLRKVT